MRAAYLGLSEQRRSSQNAQNAKNTTEISPGLRRPEDPKFDSMSAIVLWTRGASINAHRAQQLQLIDGRTAVPSAGLSPPPGETQQLHQHRPQTATILTFLRRYSLVIIMDIYIHVYIHLSIC